METLKRQIAENRPENSRGENGKFTGFLELPRPTLPPLKANSIHSR